MTKSWIYFYLIIGGMTVAGMVQPDLIVLGMFVFILPGIAMVLAPPVLMYGILLHLCLSATKGRSKLMRRRIATAVIGAVAVGPAILLNERERRLESALTAGDSPSPVEAPQAQSITILQNLADRTWQGRDLDQTRRDAGTRCEDLCLRLLYNDGFETVTIAYAPDARPDHDAPAVETTTYKIERRSSCLGSDHERIASWGGETSPGSGLTAEAAVRAQMAAGRCVERVAGRAEQSELTLLMISTPPKPGRGGNPLALNPDTLEAHRLELRRTANQTPPIYRKTFVTRQPLTMPFAISYVDAGQLSVRPGLAFSDRTRTSFESERATFLALFGKRVRQPDPGLAAEDLAALAMAALDDPITSAGIVTQRVNAMIIGAAGRRRASAQEAAVLVRALGDARFSSLRELGVHGHLFNGQIDGAARDIMRRMLDPPMTNDADPGDRVSITARLVRGLSPEGVRSIGPELMRLTEMPWTRERGRHAVRRLGDIGPEGVAKLLELTRGSLEIDARAGLCLIDNPRPDVLDSMRAALRADISAGGGNGLSSSGRLAAETLARAGRAGEFDAMGAQGGTKISLSNITALASRPDNGFCNN